MDKTAGCWGIGAERSEPPATASASGGTERVLVHGFRLGRALQRQAIPLPDRPGHVYLGEPGYRDGSVNKS